MSILEDLFYRYELKEHIEESHTFNKSHNVFGVCAFQCHSLGSLACACQKAIERIAFCVRVGHFSALVLSCPMCLKFLRRKSTRLQIKARSACLASTRCAETVCAQLGLELLLALLMSFARIHWYP